MGDFDETIAMLCELFTNEEKHQLLKYNDGDAPMTVLHEDNKCTVAIFNRAALDEILTNKPKSVAAEKSGNHG